MQARSGDLISDGPSSRLSELGIVLPAPPAPLGAYVESSDTGNLLFLSGTRDVLAYLDLLQPVCKKLGKRATLHLLDTADHSFRTLKRSRKSDEDVFVEMARTVREWASTTASHSSSADVRGSPTVWPTR